MCEVSVSIDRMSRGSDLSWRSKLASLALLFLAAMFAVLLREPALAAPTAGTVVAWGDSVIPYVEPGTRFSRIAAGTSHNLALELDGTVVGWGNNFSGLATVPMGLSNVVAIAAGGSHSLVLRSDGTVFAWGYNLYGQTTVPAGLSNVVAVAAGDRKSTRLNSSHLVISYAVFCLK